MTVESVEVANKRLVLRIWQELFNEGKLDVIEDCFQPHFRNHEVPPGMPLQGAQHLRQLVPRIREAVPEGQFTVLLQVAEGDFVASLVSWRGTHQGPYRGVPPTGKRFATTQMHAVRIEEGKVAEHWAVRDDLTLLQQVGLLPSMEEFRERTGAGKGDGRTPAVAI